MSEVQEEDLIIQQGSVYLHVFSYVDSVGAAKNLTGFTARMQIRKKITSATPEYDSATGNDITITDAVNGKITLVIPTAVTALFTFSSGFYDIEIVDSSGEATRILQGEVTLSKEVTR